VSGLPAEVELGRTVEVGIFVFISATKPFFSPSADSILHN